jgi:hypothetical protein
MASAPKLKPLKDDKDLAAVPIDEPVLVELEPVATGLDLGADTDRDKGGDDDDKRQRTRKKDDDTDPVKVLQTQMEDMRRANATETARLVREAEEARREATEAKAANTGTEKELLSSSLTGAQDAEAAAQAEFEKAFEAGDAKAMALAQSKIGRAAARVLHYEGAIADFEARPKAEPEGERDGQDKPQQFTSVEAAIDARADLTDVERKWLKEHQDAWVDPARNQELAVAYRRAIGKGLQRGTPAYFKFIEEFMGYSEPGTGDENDDDNNDEDRSAIVSAPVSRDNRSTTTGRPQAPNRIMLNAEQRGLARSMGLTDTQYARGVLQLEQNKKSDPERYRAR